MTEALPSKPLATPLDPPASTSEPMQAVGMDLFAAGSNDYLVMVDRHSGYPWVHCLTYLSVISVIGITLTITAVVYVVRQMKIPIICGRCVRC